jgi:large subunit ribosomal protein L4
MPKAPLDKQDGSKAGEIELSDAVFGCENKPALVHQVVVSQRANLRQDNATRKNRSMVRGGGAKPWRQKGTGRARQGSIRAVQWVGGGRAFGGQWKNSKHDIPRKFRQGALCAVLSEKYRGDNLKVVETIELSDIKTKSVQAILDKLELEQGTILVHGGLSDKVLLSARNISGLRLVRSQDLSVLDAVESMKLLLDKAAVENLEDRLSRR